ncbi:MAG: hypothetical protein JWM58_4526 [Rhizobium sp.]|nr:hypothetical protein [Rhizobium sp.]
MLDEKEDRIKSEAYHRWEREGRPHGEHDRHWQEATKALETGEASDIIESEGTTQALKVPKMPKAKAAKAVIKAPDVIAEAPRRARAKKAAE